MMVEPIGLVRSPWVDPVDDDWSDVIATITLDGRFSPESLSGLAEFSHVEIVYLFNQVDPDAVETAVRHPRGNERWPAVGIFAQRGKSRPNRLGVSVCRLLGVEGRTLTVQALDAIDATPVLDIKPYMEEFAPRGPIRQPAWSHELMAGYWCAPPIATQPGESMATRRSYDLVAERYADELSAELAGKPLDRGLLDALAELSAPGVMVDVGCGPGHVTARPDATWCAGGRLGPVAGHVLCRSPGDRLGLRRRGHDGPAPSDGRGGCDRLRIRSDSSWRSPTCRGL